MPVGRDEIQRQHAQAKTSAYLLTMPLLSSSLLGDKGLFENIRTDFLTHFKLDPYVLMKEEANYDMIVSAIQGDNKKDTFFNAWLWGRYLLASYTLDPTSNETTHLRFILKTLLIPNSKTTDKSAIPFYVWAKAYCITSLADEKEYGAYKVSLQEDLKHQIDLNDDRENLLWSLVMAISAAGEHHDAVFYATLKQQLIDITQKENIVDALSFIPPGSSGYRVWAFSLVRQASLMISDKTTASMIESEWETLITQPEETDYGKALATLIYESSYAAILKPR